MSYKNNNKKQKNNKKKDVKMAIAKKAPVKKVEKKAVVKKETKKVVKLTAAAASLKKLTGTVLLTNFVKKNNGSWGHEEWVALTEKVLAKYPNIDLDQVGVALEAKRDALAAK